MAAKKQPKKAVAVKKATTRKKAAPKNLGGRPIKPIDYDTLEKLCGIACTGEESASFLGISYDTLNRGIARDFADEPVEEDRFTGFADYYKRHSAAGKISLRRVQYQTALQGNATMQIWLGKQERWLNQTDKDDGHREGVKPVINLFAPVPSPESE